MTSALFRYLTKSPGAVRGWILTLLMVIDSPRGEIFIEPQSEEDPVIFSFFHFVILSNSCFSQRCSNCFSAHRSLVHVCNLVPSVHWQLSALHQWRREDELTNLWGPVFFLVGTWSNNYFLDSFLKKYLSKLWWKLKTSLFCVSRRTSIMNDVSDTFIVFRSKVQVWIKWWNHYYVVIKSTL